MFHTLVSISEIQCLRKSSNVPLDFNVSIIMNTISSTGFSPCFLSIVNYCKKYLTHYISQMLNKHYNCKLGFEVRYLQNIIIILVN